MKVRWKVPHGKNRAPWAKRDRLRYYRSVEKAVQVLFAGGYLYVHERAKILEQLGDVKRRAEQTYGPATKS